jgi:hypothetical protein
MSLPIAGFNITLPLDVLGRIFAKIRHGSDPIPFVKGSRYQINGEWFQVEQVLATGLVLRLVNEKSTIKEKNE